MYTASAKIDTITRKRAADNSDWMETVRNCGHEICISFITLTHGLRASVKNKKRKIENTADIHSSWWQWSYLYGYLKVFFFSRAESLRDDKFEPVEQTGHTIVFLLFFNFFLFFLPLSLSPFCFSFFTCVCLFLALYTF